MQFLVLLIFLHVFNVLIKSEVLGEIIKWELDLYHFLGVVEDNFKIIKCKNEFNICSKI